MTVLIVVALVALVVTDVILVAVLFRITARYHELASTFQKFQAARATGTYETSWNLRGRNVY